MYDEKKTLYSFGFDTKTCTFHGTEVLLWILVLCKAPSPYSINLLNGACQVYIQLSYMIDGCVVLY